MEVDEGEEKGRVVQNGIHHTRSGWVEVKIPKLNNTEQIYSGYHLISSDIIDKYWGDRWADTNSMGFVVDVTRGVE